MAFCLNSAGLCKQLWWLLWQKFVFVFHLFFNFLDNGSGNGDHDDSDDDGNGNGDYDDSDDDGNGNSNDKYELWI